MGRIDSVLKVGPGEDFSPRHPTHFEASSLELDTAHYDVASKIHQALSEVTSRAAVARGPFRPWYSAAWHHVGGRVWQILVASSSTRILNPLYLSSMAPYDAASTICRALACYVIDTQRHRKRSSGEGTGLVPGPGPVGTDG